MLVLSYFFRLVSLFYSFRLDTSCLQLRAVVGLGIQALDRVFLACNSYTFGVLNPGTTFNHLLAIVLSNTLFLQVGFPAHCTAITSNALSLCLTYLGTANFLQPARRCYAVSLNLLHNLHCSWSVIPRIFFHLVVSTFCYCRLKIAPVFLASALHCNHLCSSSSTSFSSSLWILLYLKFLHLFCFLPSSRHSLNFFHATSQLLHRCSPILTNPTFKSTSWFTSSMATHATCRCSPVTFKSYFSLLVYVNKTPQPSATVLYITVRQLSFCHKILHFLECFL